MTEKKDANHADEHFLKMFEQGKAFMKDLLAENEKLRRANAALRVKEKELDGQRVQEDLRRMQQKNRLLEEEVQHLVRQNEDLKGQLAQTEEENRDFSERYAMVERLNSDLISMYVASCRLHSTVSYPRILQVMQEILINMVGAFTFGVYTMDETEGGLVLIAHEGLEHRGGEVIPVGEGVAGRVAETGQTYIAQDPALAQDSESPVACFPLKIGERVAGAVVIEQLLMQKDALQVLDYQLFDFLGKHAATAIYRAKLCSLLEENRQVPRSLTALLQVDIEALG